jgi:hypothetical protein
VIFTTLSGKIMASTNRIIELSLLIAKETEKINDFFVKNKLPTPSLDADAINSMQIPDDWVEIKAARAAVIEACSELKALMTGPRELARFKVRFVVWGT